MNLRTRELAGVLILGVSVVAYAASFRLPPGFLGRGLDPSIWYAANTYRHYGLEVGRDLVHVFGPLGRLVYPVAGSGHLAQAFALSAVLHGIFLAGLITHAVRRRAYGSTAAIILLCALFLFEDPHLREAKVYGICLAWLTLDLVHPGRGIGILPAVVSAVFAFAKFNMAVTLVPMLAVQLIMSRILRVEPWRWSVAKLGGFLVPAGILGMTSFSSLHSFMMWLTRSMDLAAGNSEAMSKAGPGSVVALALLGVGLIVLLGIEPRRKPESPVALSWLLMTAVPLYFEFKHGFVRADRHIYAFFSFAPVAAASRMLFAPSRRIALILAVVVLLCALTPGILYAPFGPAQWAARARFEGIRCLWIAESLEKQRVGENDTALASYTLSDDEQRIIGAETVDLAPVDLTPLAGTSMRWKPSPFFQYMLVRSLWADSINANHLRGPDAAEFLLLSWHELDQMHPMYWCPLTYLSIMRNYSVVPRTSHRLMLRRGNGVTIYEQPLSTVVGRWEEPIEIPPSDHMVSARICVRRTLAGLLLRVLYRTPPVYLKLDDGFRSRFLPSTAANGLLVSRFPRTTAHLRHLLVNGRIHPACYRTAWLTLVSSGDVRHFANEVRVEFSELQVSPAS